MTSAQLIPLPTTPLYGQIKGVREAAAHSLGELKLASAGPHLLPAVDHVDALVRGQCLALPA